MAARKLKRAVEPGWYDFAAEIVERAGVIDEETATVLVDAFSVVPRDRFVSPALNLSAADDNALPIGFGQTISKPSTVARMLALIGLRPGMKILEVGCGSGYCSAVMAAAGAYVFALEYIGPLAQRTRRVLDGLNFQNVIVRSGDGRRGWAEHAPYDAIVVSAAFEKLDDELIKQLRTSGGRLVAPIGTAEEQILNLWCTKAAVVSRYQLEPCAFVLGA